MKKLGFILGATCAMVIAAGGVVASHLAKLPERDAEIIVEVNRDVKTLSKEGIKNTQDAVYNNIKRYATSNVRLTTRFNELNNAFVMEVNSNDIESIKNVPGVAHVTVNKAHVLSVDNNDDAIYIPLNNDGSEEELFGSSNNISAETMHKPDNTNDGEGTLVAIIDNEFHLRGKYTVKNEDGTKTTFEEWHHEVFDPLPEGTAVRYTYDSIKKVKGLNAKDREKLRSEGDEGSEYLNSKVPFYYDYGGYTTNYAKEGPGDFDVHSERGYHGSHVSSITAANAPTYKGIAPKAQLALMKVSTDYDAKGGNGIGEKLGFGSGLFMYDSTILKALEDCIKLKVDGINMSLGTDLNDFDQEDITNRTLTRLTNSGILTSISAGNAGKSSYSTTGAYANWSTSSVETGILGGFANNTNSTIVASGHPTEIFYESAFQIGSANVPFEDQITNRTGMAEDFTVEHRMKELVTDDEGHVDQTKLVPWEYIPGFGTTSDYSHRVDGKIAVVNRGSTSFADKYTIAVNKGAIGLVIINNDPTASDFNFRCSFGDGFNATIPCALALYKDKGIFESQGSGEMKLAFKQVNDNPAKNTISDFSTDGLRYDLEIKPEITAPGSNIRGAVPEHAMTNLTKSEQLSEKYLHKCYQYLSGTSMAAPNYAGAQSVVLSKVTAPIYAAAKAENRALTDEELAQIAAYKATVDMRLESTAVPMNDFTANPETNVISPTSPRQQGAGMANIGGALNTPVYLEGLDLQGNKINKSKVSLRNNADIAKGDVKISFVAHNESESALDYDVELTVMRPALAHPNDVVTKDYNFKGEIEKIDSFSGMPFYDIEIHAMSVASGETAYKDVYKVSRDFDYYATEADFNAGKKTTITKGYYYNAASEGADWQPLPSYTAQSTKDVVLAKITGQTVTIPAGESPVTINTYSLTEAQKNEILANYEYGCMIEGFVSLKSKNNNPDLSIPYAGFYSGTDRDSNASYESVPVAEPFNFQKDYTKVYPSDLVNDIAKSLVGKSNGNFESMIVAGYAERPQKIDTDKVLVNNQSFDKLQGFYNVGTDPKKDGEFTENPSNDIYLGNPEKSNTMIIQQFMLRSVVDNYFTITNKANNKVVYRSALQDMISSDTLGKWSLFKSHVDSSYLSAGYIAHRAYAIVPLYDEITGVAFESGEYELKFNYLLAGTGTEVSDTYTIHIDSKAPVFKTACEYRDENGVERVRFYFQEDKLAYGAIGYYRVDAKFDAERNMYYLDETKEFVYNASNIISKGADFRMFVSGVDYARGSTGCIIHLADEENINKGFQTVQGSDLIVSYDFEYEQGSLVIFSTDTGRDIDMSGSKLYYNGFLTNTPSGGQPNATNNGSASLTNSAMIIVVSAIVALGASFIIVSLLLKKRKGGK